MTSKTEIAMTFVDARMIVSITVDGGANRVGIGEMRQTEDGPQFTTDGFDVWITPGILEGIARLLIEVDTNLASSQGIH